MNRITGNIIRMDIKPFNKFNTLQSISSLEKKLLNYQIIKKPNLLKFLIT